MTRPALRLVKSDRMTVASLTELQLTIKEFLTANPDWSPETVEKYAHRLGQFSDWLAERGVTQLNDLSKLMLREWAASLNPKWSTATRGHAIAVVRSFLGWCRKEGLVDEQLAAALRTPKAKKRVQRTLSSEEVKKLLSACDDSMLGVRDAAIVSLMVDSGLRASEVCRLEVDDLVFDFPFKGELMNFALVVGKGGGKEPIFFGTETAVRLQAWLKVRQARPETKTVFVSLGGTKPLTKLTRFGLRDRLAELGKRVGVEKVSPHPLRRTFACLLDENGASTRKIQLLGRWSSIELVERYTQALRAGQGYGAFSPMDQLAKKAEAT